MKNLTMSRVKLIFRIFIVSMLGLLGVTLLLEGLWLAWQGGPVQGVLMVVAAGGMLAGCAWWLLFFAPPQPVTAHEPVIKPAPSSGAAAHEDDPAPVRIATRHQRLTNETPLQLATPDELRAALLDIGLRRLTGATWQEATADERWANLCVFLHCERDKLDAGSSDDVDGLYFTREEAEAAVSDSPQTANSYVWKVFVSAPALQYLSDDRKVLPHLVRAIKKELLKLPSGECPGTLVELKNWQAGRQAWLDTSGQRIVLFEDENALDGPMFTDEQTGVFKTGSGMGVFDAGGAIILPPRFEDIEPFYNGLATTKLNGRWGFVDRQERWQIEPRFLEVRSFTCADHTEVRTESGWGLIDRQGTWIVADRYAEIGWINNYRGGLRVAAVRKEGKGLWGAIQVSASETGVSDSVTQQGDEPGAAAAVDKETLLVDCVCATEDEVEERVHGYLESLKPKRESVSRLRAEAEAVDYHCNYCAKKIGDYAAVCGALREPGVSVDKYDRVYCSDACSTKAFMGASRGYEARGGDY